MSLGPFPLAQLPLTRLAAAWPDAEPLLCLAGSGRWAIIALSWIEVSWGEVAAKSLTEPEIVHAAGLPFTRGYLGLVPYDLYAPMQAGDVAARPRVFRVEQALVHDRQSGLLHVTGSPCKAPGFTTVDTASIVGRILENQAPSVDAGAVPLVPSASDEAYEQLVGGVLEDIRAGRYYQLNLLRYFSVPQVLTRGWIAARLERFGGDFSAWFSLPDLQLVSFSPERFVSCKHDGSDTWVHAFPIKGTAPRQLDCPERDAAAAAALQSSTKDRAELHMIVDLMRHDLYGASVPGSVRVVHPGRLLSLASVHHLEAEVRAKLRPGLSLGQLLAEVCPGGSITGAPKKEVMLAIRSYEGRPRGYFMGHAFYLGDGGVFDASILIRTVVQLGGGGVAFAAGGGLVIGSDPVSERQEIAAKCRVLTLP